MYEGQKGKIMSEDVIEGNKATKLFSKSFNKMIMTLSQGNILQLKIITRFTKWCKFC